MAIKSFNDYVLYKAKTVGKEEGGFYKLKTPESKDQAFLIKKMDVAGTVLEYVGSNIAHFLLGDKAPKVDLAISQEDGKTVARTVSHLLKNFKNLDEWRKDVGTSQDYIAKGFVVDKNGRILPKDVYTETELLERSPIKIIPGLKDEDEIRIVAEFVGNRDPHTANLGAIKVDENLTAAIVDFSESFQWSHGSKVNYSYMFVGDFSDLRKITQFVSKLVASQDEIMELVDQLCADMESVGLQYDFTNMKLKLLGKFNAYNHELALLDAAVSMIDGITSEASANVFENLKYVDLSLVSDQAKNFLVGAASKAGSSEALKQTLPLIVSQEEPKVVEKDKPVEFRDVDLMFAVRYGNKEKFEEVLQFFEDEYKHGTKDNHDYNMWVRVENAFVESVVTDRKYYFDKLLPLADYRWGGEVDCRWYSPKFSSSAIAKGIHRSIESNNSEIFDKLVPLCPNLFGRWAGWIDAVDNKNLFENLVKHNLNCLEVDCNVAEPIKMKIVFETVVRGENRGMLDIMLKYGMPLTEARTTEIKKVWPDFNTQADKDLVGDLNTASFATEL